MPRKTDGEKIDELEKLVATLTERLDNSRKELDSFRREIGGVSDLATKTAVIEERFNELKRGLDESGKKRWSILPPLIGVISGGLITLAGQLLIRYLLGP